MLPDVQSVKAGKNGLLIMQSGLLGVNVSFKMLLKCKLLTVYCCYRELTFLIIMA